MQVLQDIGSKRLVLQEQSPTALCVSDVESCSAGVNRFKPLQFLHIHRSGEYGSGVASLRRLERLALRRRVIVCSCSRVGGASHHDSLLPTPSNLAARSLVISTSQSPSQAH